MAGTRKGARRGSSSRSSRTTTKRSGSPPPWERATQANFRLTEQAVAQIHGVAAATGLSYSAVVDCLIRGLSEREIAAVVRTRAASDEDARAAWYRADR